MGSSSGSLISTRLIQKSARHVASQHTQEDGCVEEAMNYSFMMFPVAKEIRVSLWNIQFYRQ